MLTLNNKTYYNINELKIISKPAYTKALNFLCEMQTDLYIDNYIQYDTKTEIINTLKSYRIKEQCEQFAIDFELYFAADFEYTSDYINGCDIDL